jgi:putative YphP/YqiW family bacilliredoxin
MSANRYNPAMVQPMRDELTELGFEELLTPEAVDQALSETQGTLPVVVNSVCACAAGAARPGVRLALGHHTRPDRLATVFAGMETKAVPTRPNHFPTATSVSVFRIARAW